MKREKVCGGESKIPRKHRGGIVLKVLLKIAVVKYYKKSFVPNKSAMKFKGNCGENYT